MHNGQCYILNEIPENAFDRERTQAKKVLNQICSEIKNIFQKDKNFFLTMLYKESLH